MSTFFFGETTRIFEYSHSLGRREWVGIGGLRNPVDMALAPDGVIYVLNRSHDDSPYGTRAIRVTMITMKEEFPGLFGRHGTGDGEFVWPSSIALDSRTNVYVCDEWLNRITIFDKKGEFLDKWGSAGSKDGELNKPSGLALDKEDNLYVVDGLNHRVQVFTKDGKFLHQFGTYGSAPSQFNMPWGITIDKKGDVYVADWRNDRIQKFTADGGFLGQFGSPGSAVGRFNRPTHVAVDKDGDIYVADWLNHRVQVFTGDFRYVTTLRGDSTMSKFAALKVQSNPAMWQCIRLATESQWKPFWFPIAVDTDDQGNVVILELGRHRIQVYKKEMAPVRFSG